MEKACHIGKRSKTPLEQIPAFRNHLERENITAAQFHQRQDLTPATDMTNEALALSRKKVMTNKGKK
jgi:hypothetical protein